MARLKSQHLHSSYAHHNYGEVFEGMAFVQAPKFTIEIGVLEGYSAFHLSKWSEHLILLDLFEHCTFKHAHYEDVVEKFPTAEVKYFDFYRDPCQYKNIDLLHIDIANTGDTYRRFLSEWYPNLSEGGIALLEGGSEERDNHWWMKQYSKPRIRPVLEEWKKDGIRFHIVEAFPSLTIVKK